MSDPNQQNEEEQKNEELQKIEELKDFLQNVCESLCLNTVESKPKDIPIHMINFLQKRYGYSSSGLQYEEKKELEKLRDEVEIFRDMDEHTYYVDQQQKLQKKDAKASEKKSKVPPKPKPRLPPDEIIVSDDEEYNNPDEINENLDNPEFIQKCNLNNKRIAVTENCISEQDEPVQIKTYKKNSELIEFIRINLMKSPIFSELPLGVLRQCIDAMEEKNIPAAADVVKQGQINDTFYFIVEGELECKMQFIKVTKEGNRKKVEKFDPKLVKIYGPGDYFGELSLLYHSPRRGTIKTVTDTKAYILTRTAYKKILKSSMNEKIIRKINMFKKVPIFETLADEELEKLEQISKEAIYYNGETILKENEYSNVMFIIDKGKCIGTQTVEEGKIPVKTRDYKEGDIIGEMALLKAEKRPENIIAETDVVKFICIDRFSLKNNLGSLEPLLMRNMELYNTYFPPIVEEKPEDKNEKEENEKNKEEKSGQNQSQNQPQNESGKNNEQQQNSPNNNANVNVEEIIKKIKEEANEEKKQMEMKQNEEIEKLKQQIAELQIKNNELMNSNILNNQNIIISNENEQPQDEEEVKLKSNAKTNEMYENNNFDSQNQQMKHSISNTDNQKQPESNDNNEDNNINNNVIPMNNNENDNINNNLISNQDEKQEVNKENENEPKTGEIPDDENIPLPLLTDIITYQENENQNIPDNKNEEENPPDNKNEEENPDNKNEEENPDNKKEEEKLPEESNNNDDIGKMEIPEEPKNENAEEDNNELTKNIE